MNNTVKKIVASITVLTCAVWMMGPGLASALTAEELQVMIDELMAEIEELQDQLTELTGEAVITIEGVPADFTFETDLKQTNTGDDVKYLQIVLNSDSETQLAESGVGSAGNETSYFGPLTKAAVIKFQEKYTEDVLASWGLTEGTGYVGSTTRAKLNSLLAAAEEEEEEEEVPEGLTSVSPAADATDVALDTEIEAVFDVALDEDTVNATSVGLFTDTTTTVEGTVSYDSDTKTITFTPSEDLAYETEYTVTLTTDITADDEAVLDEDYSWSFTTEEAPVVAPGLTVALSADTPATRMIPYNVMGYVYTIITAKAGAGGEDVTITGLTVDRTGLGAYNDFDKIYVLVDGVRHGSKRVLGSDDTVDLRFTTTASKIVLTAGESVDIKITADMDIAAVAGHYSILQVSAIESDAEEVTADFPIAGNYMTLSSIAAPTVDFTYRGGAGGNVDIGDDQVEVAEIEVANTSPTEDISLKSITLEQKESAKNDEVINYTLYSKGEEVVSAVNATADDYVTFVFEEPMTIEDGDDVRFVVKADIYGGRDNEIKLVLDEETDLVAIGLANDFQALVTITNAGGEATYVIQGGELSVTEATDNPKKSNIAPDTKDVPFLKAKFTAAEETLVITSVQVDINYVGVAAEDSDGAELDNVTLRINGTVVAGPVDYDAAAVTANAIVFDEEFEVSGSEIITVEADITDDTTVQEDDAWTMDIDSANITAERLAWR